MYRGMLWFALTVLIPLASCFDPLISNGTCYFRNGQQSADSFIPCGNAAGGVQSCCQARDVCLSSNACFNAQYYVTYLAGCTDESYSDSSCPNKGEFADQQWVGLVRCFVSNGTSGEEWAPCQESSTTVDASNDQCACDPASSTAVFTAGATLTDIASLPVRIGNDIAWFSGYTPSTSAGGSTTTGTGTTTTSPGGSEATITPAPGTTSTNSHPTPSSTSSPSDKTSLSTAAKAGIGVAVAAGALAIAALLLWLLWSRRRQNKQAPPVEDQIPPQSGSPNQMSEQYAGWGAKSELPTDANEIRDTDDAGQSPTGSNTVPTSATSYRPYHRSSAAEPSEMDASPAASSSALVPGGSSHEKEKYPYGKQVFEMPA